MSNDVLGAILIVLALVVALWGFIVFARCQGCRKRWGPTKRWNSDRGIHIECQLCGHIEIIPWEDLH